MTPPWLPLAAALPGREAEIARLLGFIDEAATVEIIGPPGLGRTSLAGAVARASGRELVAFSLLGCEDADDAVRVVGEAVGAVPCGDEQSVHAALRTRNRPLLLADDVSSVAALDAVERVVSLLADARLLVVSTEPHASRHVVLGPLPGGGLHDAVGNPTLARLAGGLGVPVGESLTALGPDLPLLAAFPCGLPRGAVGRLPAVVLRPDLRDRMVLRAGVAARLPGGPRLSLTDPLRKAVLPLLDLARGAHLARLPDSRDIMMLRLIEGACGDDEDLASELRAARVRLLHAAGQVDPARELIRTARPAGYRAIGVLGWADTELLLLLGETDEAWARAMAAADALGAAGEVAMRGALWRRVAERLGERGEIERADEAWRRARQAARMTGDESGVAAAMRGAAGLALSQGESVGAAVLNEEAGATFEGVSAEEAGPEQLNVLLTDLTLALMRGEAGRIRRTLDQVETAAGDDALLLANLWRRRADALLRMGDHEGAALAVERAAGLYGQLGEVVARGTSFRLAADIAAVAGRPDASELYARALAWQIRVRDWHGLGRTLDHAATLAEHLGDTDRARLLREQRAGAVRARGE